MATNIWNVEEYTGDGVSCPITPVNLPWYKQVGLFFFRFGVCPLCVTSSVGYSVVRAVRTHLGAAPKQQRAAAAGPWLAGLVA